MGEPASVLRRFPIFSAWVLFAVVALVRAAALLVVRVEPVWLADGVAALFGVGLTAVYLVAAHRRIAEVGLHAYGRRALVCRAAAYSAVAVLLGYASELGAYSAAAGEFQPARQVPFFAGTMEQQAMVGALSVMIVVAAGVLRAFMEETMFRGVLLSHLRTRVAGLRANVVQALAFGVWNALLALRLYLDGTLEAAGTPLGVPAYLGVWVMFGLVWGYAAIVSASVWYAWVSHVIVAALLPLVQFAVMPPEAAVWLAGGWIRYTIAAFVLALLTLRLRRWAYPPQVELRAEV